jgi:acetyltransferase-like isoleucine patch superfamily enzyme
MRYCEITNADIGNYCSIANNVAIGAAEHPYTRLSTSPQLYRSVIKCGDGNGDARGKTVVGSDVWIGNNAVIKAGVRVGHGAVIGAGSVVTHDVPPYAIAVGSPAKIIKYRFDGATIERLLGMSWWEWSEEEIIRNRDLFTSDPLN